MNAYYQITQKIFTLLTADQDVNTVTKGDVTRIDTNVKNIFPLAHLYVGEATFSTQTITFSVQVFAMNKRYEKEEVVSDKFIGNDNEDDNLNAMLYVLLRLFLQLEKQGGDYRIDNTPTLESFTEDGTNVVDGWVMSFDIEYPITEVDSC